LDTSSLVRTSPLLEGFLSSPPAFSDTARGALNGFPPCTTGPESPFPLFFPYTPEVSPSFPPPPPPQPFLLFDPSPCSSTADSVFPFSYRLGKPFFSRVSPFFLYLFFVHWALLDPLLWAGSPDPPLPLFGSLADKNNSSGTKMFPLFFP